MDRRGMIDGMDADCIGVVIYGECRPFPDGLRQSLAGTAGAAKQIDCDFVLGEFIAAILEIVSISEARIHLVDEVGALADDRIRHYGELVVTDFLLSFSGPLGSGLLLREKRQNCAKIFYTK